MGFRKENYEVEKIGITVPFAYAAITALEVNGGRAKAVFGIHVSREQALTSQPIEKKVLWFDVNRNENPYVTAYRQAKAVTVETIEEDGEQKTVEKRGIFSDWADDIVYKY